MKKMTPKAGNSCFGCGADNPLGLKLTFHGDSEAGTAWTDFEPPAFLAGGIDTMHGGFISLLLDEVSSKVLATLGKQGVTRHLNVSFEKPVSLSHRVHLKAELIKQEGRKHFINAQLMNSDDVVLAKSEALFLMLRS